MHYCLNQLPRCLRTAFVAIVLVLAGRLSANAANVDVHVGIGVPAPPVVTFETEPKVVVVPQTHIYYAPSVAEYDMYRSGNYWYVNRDGYWYRSHGYRGPFRAVQYRQVPHQIIVVPDEYRHHPRHPNKAPHGHGHHEEH